MQCPRNVVEHEAVITAPGSWPDLVEGRSRYGPVSALKLVGMLSVLVLYLHIPRHSSEPAKLLLHQVYNLESKNRSDREPSRMWNRKLLNCWTWIDREGVRNDEFSELSHSPRKLTFVRWFPRRIFSWACFIILAYSQVLNLCRALCTCLPQTHRLTSTTRSPRIILALVQAISVLGSLLLMRGKPHVQIVTVSCGNSML